MMRAIYLLFSLTLFYTQVSGQSYKQQFDELASKKDTVGELALLEKWQKKKADDPELYVAYFNYYVLKSKKEMVTLGQNPKGEDVLKVMSEDTTKKEPVAYMYDYVYYSQDILSRGFDWITNGIEKYPKRLDMRFGKIYMLGKVKDYEKFTTEIIKAIDYSFSIKNKWTWADDKPLDNPKDFMLGSIQDYQLQLYNTENDSLLDNMKRIAETVLKYYPDHIESLSNLSIVYMLHKQYDEALVPLFKAQKLNPQDFIVLNNIAQAYKLKGDKKNAIKYYELTWKYGDEQAKSKAQEEINKLKKN